MNFIVFKEFLFYILLLTGLIVKFILQGQVTDEREKEKLKYLHSW